MIRKLFPFALAAALVAAVPAFAQKTVPDSVGGGIYNSTPPSLQNYQLAPFQMDSSGRLIVNVGSGGGTGGTSSTFDAAFPGTGTAIGISDGTNMKALLAPLILGDGVNGNNMLSVGNWWWNGTTWDRAKGDATNGAFVQLKTAVPAGANIIGKVGIDQTTDVTTNGVEIAPTAGAAAGVAPGVSGSGEASHVLKAGAGNLYGVYATNLTATAGFLVVLDATSAPGDGAITPKACAPLPASGYASINYNPGPPAAFGTGITAVVTSAATCFTKTTGVITAFIAGAAK